MPTWLGQGNAAITGSQALRNNACCPTATANGLAYLEQYASSIAFPDPFAVSPDNYTTINTFISMMGTTPAGTLDGNQLSALRTYLGSNAPNVTVAQSLSSNVTAGVLGNALSARNAVELGITWGNGTTFNNGGHELTLVSMSLSGGSGTMTVLDPWGAGVGTNAGTAGVLETLTVSTLNLTAANLPGFDAPGNYLEITYPITVSGPDDTFSQDGTTARGGNGQMGIIDADTIETLVPEPTSVALFGVGVAGVALRRFLRRV
ncbi:MAG TPA: PEP-CTERM sorting domain-containing protein [Candidatus Acidoferrum sp.]|nr:PEP-CTERM sorting domain-containing protein [Candidatus Acidoferrum sp.]